MPVDVDGKKKPSPQRTTDPDMVTVRPDDDTMEIAIPTEAIAKTARATAPVDTGDYRDGIKTAGKLQKRYVGLVVGTDPKTMLVESQTGNLARALRANAKGGRRG